MKIALAVILAAALLTSPAVAQTPAVATDDTAAVNAVIDRLHEAASTADGAAYFDLFTPEARFIGTDATERWSLEQFRAYAMTYFSQGRGWTYHPRDRVVSILPIECRCVASFDELLDNAAYGETRGSGVLIRTADGWKIDQYVLSFAVPNAVAKEVVGVIAAGATPTPAGH